MQAAGPNELVLIRHAAADHGDRLCGRTDVPVKPAALAGTAAICSWLPSPAMVVTSPAKRCRQTAVGLWPAIQAQIDERLLEQDFGEHEGRPFTQLPDIGNLTPEALANHRPPAGESFRDVIERVRPSAMYWAKIARQQSGPVALVAHAGSLRATMAALTDVGAAALSFEYDCLAVTRLRCYPSGISIASVNVTLPGRQD